MRAVQGVRGILRATGKQAERQEVAWACARALRPRACAYWREEEGDKGGGSGGLGRPDGAGPGKWRQASGPGGLLSLSIYFCSVLFYLICFATVLNLKIIQTMPKTPLNILYC